MSFLEPDRLRFRTTWISDIHPGTRGCKADLLLDFLKSTESDCLYLVGDIIDIWRLKRTWYRTDGHNEVIQLILRKARKGTRAFFIPGNHDERIRDFGKHRFGRVTVLNEAIHVTADGRRFLVLHGDQFDAVVRHAKWLAVLGDRAYAAALVTNHWFNLERRRVGFPCRSLSSYLKHKVKDAVEYISRFETAVVEDAARRQVDGVVCGHIHCAAIGDHGGITCCNDGDWVESCTALVGDRDGQIEILDWMQLRHLSPFEEKECASPSYRMPGFLKSMASFVRSTTWCRSTDAGERQGTGRRADRDRPRGWTGDSRPGPGQRPAGPPAALSRFPASRRARAQ